MVDITNTSNLAADRALAYEAIERQPETEEIAASNEQEAEAKQPGNIGDHVAMYLSQIGSIPIMPQVEANRCIEKVQKGKSGRSRDDSGPYPFVDLFDLRTYTGAVHILSLDGKCISDVAG